MMRTNKGIVMSSDCHGKKKTGLYIHIPFCERKCSYCGFLSFPCKGDDPAAEEYVHSLIHRIKAYGAEMRDSYVCDSVFIGGGTPSILSSYQMEMIMESIRDSFVLLQDAEITSESNPNSLSAEKLSAWRKAGINRLSIGFQSTDDKILKLLGRVHSGLQCFRAFEMARDAGFDNINIDLMSAVAGQTDEILLKSLEDVCNLGPEHISCYSLQIEEGTEFYRLYKDGVYPEVSGEGADRMYLLTAEYLAEHGYSRYEISNFAKKGYECRHNLKYWNMDSYTGIGPGASGFIENRRYSETENLGKWMNNAETEEKPFSGIINSCCEETEEDSIATFVITGMRKAEGISLKEFRNRYGKEFSEFYKNIMPYLREEESAGNISMSDERIALTEKGILISNDILCEFV